MRRSDASWRLDQRRARCCSAAAFANLAVVQALLGTTTFGLGPPQPRQPIDGAARLAG
jgi:hypothetical protein